jgi:SEC-C motif domain protein
MSCPCGSNRDFADCCGPYLQGAKKAPTAEALMRSRYTAFARGDISYIKNTLAPESRHDFDEAGVREWSTKSDWVGLEIRNVEKGGESDTTGVVEFVAKYSVQGNAYQHHEISQFRRDQKDGWYFVDGEQQGAIRETVVRESPKIGRNDPCPCGSGKKHKKCCGAA